MKGLINRIWNLFIREVSTVLLFISSKEYPFEFYHYSYSKIKIDHPIILQPSSFPPSQIIIFYNHHRLEFQRF